MLLANGYCTFFIPESHDEQRLTDGGSDYGPVAYSFAAPWLRNINDHFAFDTGYVNVAIIDVAGTDLFPPYHALGLEPGQNCLYLFHDHPGDGQPKWKAIMAKPNLGICNGGKGHPLPADFEQPSITATDYPAVTRWVQTATMIPQIGVRCGNMWCNVGPGAPSNAPFATLPTAGTSARWKVRGWFDDQNVGVPTAPGASRFGILPGERLSIVPDDLLETRDTVAFKAAWVVVARILVPPSTNLPPKYSSSPGFALDTGMNVLSMRAFHSPGTAMFWKAMIVNGKFPMGHMYVRDVMWTDHSPWTNWVPATARFRWRDSDEEIWVRCDLGCCMIQPD